MLIYHTCLSTQSDENTQKNCEWIPEENKFSRNCSNVPKSCVAYRNPSDEAQRNVSNFTNTPDEPLADVKNLPDCLRDLRDAT